MLARHVKGAGRGGNKADVIDVLSLSIGYYAEDSLYTSGPVADLLGSFRERGILVVAGVGNDGTAAPFVPAALAAEVTPKMDAVPVASVGAWNPNGRTVALFSNDLPVVTYLRHGVSVVSTFPPTNGIGQPSSSMPDTHGRLRTTVDFDDYTGRVRRVDGHLVRDADPRCRARGGIDCLGRPWQRHSQGHDAARHRRAQRLCHPVRRRAA